MTNRRKLNSNPISATTQKYLDIAEIREDTVVMRDGTLRAVLMVSSINFSLKSEDEQNAIIAQYVGFLNNIDFPLQIVVQSRELSIENYLNSLKQKEKEQTNELLKIQTSGYIQYILELISIGKIMSKRFYVVIPYNPLSDSHKSFLASIGEIFKPATTLKMKDNRFKKLKKELELRIENVMSGLNSVGLNSVLLDTQSLIELYYNTYNPRTSANEKLVDVKHLRIDE